MKRRQELPIVSGILVAANVIVYLICTFTGNLLYNIGELDAAAVLLHREYGRIIYSMFLHAGIDHLFNNMVILFFLGCNDRKSDRTYPASADISVVGNRCEYLLAAV